MVIFVPLQDDPLFSPAPMEILLERIQRRAMEERPITREEMERWAASFQSPSQEEMKRFDSAVVLGDCAAG